MAVCSVGIIIEWRWNAVETGVDEEHVAGLNRVA